MLSPTKYQQQQHSAPERPERTRRRPVPYDLSRYDSPSDRTDSNKQEQAGLSVSLRFDITASAGSENTESTLDVLASSIFPDKDEEFGSPPRFFSGEDDIKIVPNIPGFCRRSSHDESWRHCRIKTTSKSLNVDIKSEDLDPEISPQAHIQGDTKEDDVFTDSLYKDFDYGDITSFSQYRSESSEAGGEQQLRSLDDCLDYFLQVM